jgi:hypothetical protein
MHILRTTTMCCIVLTFSLTLNRNLWITLTLCIYAHAYASPYCNPDPSYASWLLGLRAHLLMYNCITFLNQSKKLNVVFKSLKDQDKTTKKTRRPSKTRPSGGKTRQKAMQDKTKATQDLKSEASQDKTNHRRGHSLLTRQDRMRHREKVLLSLHIYLVLLITR